MFETLTFDLRLTLRRKGKFEAFYAHRITVDRKDWEAGKIGVVPIISFGDDIHVDFTIARVEE